MPTSGGVVVPRVPTSGGLAGPRALTSGKCAMQFFSSPCVFLNTSPANVGSLHLGRIPNCSEVPDIDVCRRVPTSGRGVVPRVPTSGGRLRSRAPTCGLPHTNTTSGPDLHLTCPLYTWVTLHNPDGVCFESLTHHQYPRSCDSLRGAPLLPSYSLINISAMLRTTPALPHPGAWFYWIPGRPPVACVA